MTYVLDTHPIVWFLEGSGRISAQAGTVLRDPSHRFILPTIVMVEITYLYSKGRIAVDIAVVQQRLVAADNCVLYPLDEQVAMRIPTGTQYSRCHYCGNGPGVPGHSPRACCRDHEEMGKLPEPDSSILCGSGWKRANIFCRGQHIHTGEQNHRCKDCGRQFVRHAAHRLMDIDRLISGGAVTP